MHYEINVV
jgi:hypothetical protein